MIITNENAVKELPNFLIRHKLTQTDLHIGSGVGMDTIKKLIYGEPVSRKMVFDKINAFVHSKEGNR